MWMSNTVLLAIELFGGKPAQYALTIQQSCLFFVHNDHTFPGFPWRIFAVLYAQFYVKT
jgi:hypothetical protein